MAQLRRFHIFCTVVARLLSSKLISTLLSIICCPVVERRYHRGLVRDCSWHPFEPEITTASWDGSIVSWAAGSAPGDEPAQPERTGKGAGGVPAARRDVGAFW